MYRDIIRFCFLIFGNVFFPVWLRGKSRKAQRKVAGFILLGLINFEDVEYGTVVYFLFEDIFGNL